MRAARQTNKNPYYKVEQVSLQTEGGYATPYLANRRVDTKEVLGICTDQYELVDNEELVGRAEEAMRHTGLPQGERKFRILEGGAKFYAQYDFLHVNRKVAKVNEELGLRLTIQNSFDRSLRVAVTLGMVRLICTNGMMTSKCEFSLTQKHSTNLDLNFMREAIDAALIRYEESTESFNRLAAAAIDHEKGLNILDKLVDRNVLSAKLRDGISKIWNDPTHKEDEGRNLWNLYNAAAEHLTHEVSKDRYAYANRINSAVLRHLNKEISFAA